MDILVCGWYFHKNLGDDLFIQAFQFLFPNYNLIFTNHITIDLLNVDAVFIGGGSFLESPLDLSPQAFQLLKTKKIFYLGIGAETNIDAMHQELLSLAKLVAIRSHNVWIETLNHILIPDLVYCLPVKYFSTKINKSVLIIPNISVIPSWNEEHWKHTAWNYFKTEFVQFIDFLIDNNYAIDFLPMCLDEKLNDMAACYEIINNSKYREKLNIIDTPLTFNQSTLLFSKYQYVISQRFHGLVLSEVSETPCLVISHHQKLISSKNISYYNLSKNKLIESFQSLKNYSHLAISSNIFTELVQRVNDEICRY